MFHLYKCRTPAGLSTFSWGCWLPTPGCLCKALPKVEQVLRPKGIWQKKEINSYGSLIYGHVCTWDSTLHVYGFDPIRIVSWKLKGKVKRGMSINRTALARQSATLLATNCQKVSHQSGSQNPYGHVRRSCLFTDTGIPTRGFPFEWTYGHVRPSDFGT